MNPNKSGSTLPNTQFSNSTRPGMLDTTSAEEPLPDLGVVPWLNLVHREVLDLHQELLVNNMEPWSVARELLSVGAIQTVHYKHIETVRTEGAVYINRFLLALVWRQGSKGYVPLVSALHRAKQQALAFTLSETEAFLRKRYPPFCHESAAGKNLAPLKTPGLESTTPLPTFSTPLYTPHTQPLPSLPTSPQRFSKDAHTQTSETAFQAEPEKVQIPTDESGKDATQNPEKNGNELQDPNTNQIPQVQIPTDEPGKDATETQNPELEKRLDELAKAVARIPSLERRLDEIGKDVKNIPGVDDHGAEPTTPREKAPDRRRSSSQANPDSRRISEVEKRLGYLEQKAIDSPDLSVKMKQLEKRLDELEQESTTGVQLRRLSSRITAMERQNRSRSSQGLPPP